MTAPFTPVHVQFSGGIRQDIGKFAANPSQLTIAENVMFTKKGHVTGRPSLVSKEAQAQVSPTSALVASLKVAATGLTPSGIVATGFQGAQLSDVDTPLACYQGQSYYNRAGLWVASGTHWSLRQTKSAIVKTYDPSAASRANPVPVGQHLIATPTTGANGAGFAFLNTEGEVTSISLGSLTNFTSDSNHCVAGDSVFFIDNGTSNVIAQLTSSPPTVAQFTVGSGANTSSVAAQRTSAVLAVDGFYYLAFTSATAGRIDVVRISSAGSVTQTLSLTGLGTVQNLGLVHNGTSSLGLAWMDTAAGPAIKTKVLSITAGTMADTGLNLTLTGTALNILGLDVGCLSVGVTHNGQMSVLFSNNVGGLYIGGRLFTAATESSRTTLVANGLGAEREWDPLFGGVVLAGRTLIGVLNSMDIFNQSSQWIVLDVTALYGSGNTTDRTVAAAGPYLGAARMMPSSVYSTATSVSFSVAEGISFSGAERPVSVIRRAGVRRITLSAQGVQGVHVNGVTLLSGQLAHVFDGTAIRPDHFAEEMPFIFSTTAASAGGSLAAGSYTYQVTWEAVNSRGQVIRSGASNQKTVAVTASQKVTVVATKPQLWNTPSQLEFVRIRLWATQVNPTNNSLLYFVTEVVDTNPSGGTPVSLVHTVGVVGNEEALYETTDTLSDMRSPGADRGIAVVNERVWVADQNHLYASKLIRPGIAVAWNTESTNVLTLPTALGTVQALSSINQSLVVLGSRGAAVVSGPGVDDTGAGPGWTLQIIDGVPGMGSSGPRSVAATPGGVVFQAQDGQMWLVNSSGQAQPISRPVRDLSTPQQIVDVVNVTSSPSGTNSMVMANGVSAGLQVVRVLDLENGQWMTWRFPRVTPSNGLFIASISGFLWLQTTSPGAVYSAENVSTTSGGDEDITPVVATIETGVLSPATPILHGWGRLQKVLVNEFRTLDTGPTTTIRMQVFADQDDHTLMDKTLFTNPDLGLADPHAGDGVLRFSTSSQRCSTVRVNMTLTPAIFDMEGLDLWVMNTGEANPTNMRS